MGLGGLTFPLGVSVLSPAPGRHRRRGERSCAGKPSALSHPFRDLLCARLLRDFQEGKKSLPRGYFPIPSSLRSSQEASREKGVLESQAPELPSPRDTHVSTAPKTAEQGPAFPRERLGCLLGGITFGQSEPASCGFRPENWLDSHPGISNPLQEAFQPSEGN